MLSTETPQYKNGCVELRSSLGIVVDIHKFPSIFLKICIFSSDIYHQSMSAFKSERDAGFDLGKYAEQRVRVKFTGGREVDGVLKGFDKLDNLVLDECTEFIRGT
jgi:hypothetical protein